MTSSDGTWTPPSASCAAPPDADDTLTYMVFAEQRLLAMCAENAHAAALSDLPALFGGAQNGIFYPYLGLQAANAGES